MEVDLFRFLPNYYYPFRIVASLHYDCMTSVGYAVTLTWMPVCAHKNMLKSSMFEEVSKLKLCYAIKGMYTWYFVLILAFLVEYLKLNSIVVSCKVWDMVS